MSPGEEDGSASTARSAELILSSMKKVDIQPSIRYTQFRTILQWLLYKINNSMAFILRRGGCKKWQSDIKK